MSQNSRESQYQGRITRSQRISEARKKGTHTPEQWHDLIQEFRCCCVRCGKLGKTVKDHILPLYLGGSDGIDNIQPLCSHCNGSKGPESVNWALIRRIQMSNAALTRRLNPGYVPEADDLPFLK